MVLTRKNILGKPQFLHSVLIKTLLREEDDLDNLVDETMEETMEEERSRKESSNSNSSTSSSDSNVSIQHSNSPTETQAKVVFTTT